LLLLKNLKVQTYIGFAILLVAALFSEGFLHPDEHYQILELLHLKTSDWTISGIFNWDYHERIRPWFQVLFYYPLTFLTSDPFSQATLVRVANALIACFAIFILNKKNVLKLNPLIIASLWFIPLLIVRTNSETLSTSLFLIGSAFYLEKKQSSSSRIWSAVFWGLSFLTRYQMGVVIFFVNIWQLYRDKKIASFILHCCVLGLTISLGVFIDYWGYGEWTSSAWNYFYSNIVQSKASNFGVEPFWYYLYKPVIKGGVVIPLALAWGLYRYTKKNGVGFWSVALLSFFLIHSAIPHKEVRFLTFNYIVMALIFSHVLSSEKITLKGFKWWGIPLIVLNTLVLLKVCFAPANSDIDLYRQVYQQSPKTIYGLGEEKKLFSFSMPFYQKGPIETKSFSPSVLTENTSFLLTTKYNEIKQIESLAQCQKVYSSYPNWVASVNISGWLERTSFYVLWQCRQEAQQAH
jgi:phosphatidylinositol glycan class B